MKTYIIAAVILICSFTLSQSPYTNIQISNQFSPNEVSISINPKNINQLVGGANLESYYYSTNGGTNWTRGTMTNSSWGVWGDPCIIADTNNNFYYFHLSNTPGQWIDRIVCQKSTNGGMTWSNPGSYTYVNWPRQQDKEWAIVDWSRGSRGNWIYCTWTQFDDYGSTLTTDSSNIFFARSTDAGITWTGVTRINKLGGNCIDEDYTVEGAVPAVGPAGQVYVAWAGPQGVNSFKIFFDKSTDGGNTWLANDIIAANNPGGWDLGSGSPSGLGVYGIYRANGMPITCCDLSNGPYRGYIYINYLDSAGNHDRDVKIVKSTDGGNTWSAPIRVNNDPPGKEQFFTWMTIDMATGYLYVVFYDRRNYADNQTDVFMAVSTNGGTTWTNERISASVFTPVYSQFFGDYICITAHNGRVRPIWMRRDSGGGLSVWTALIDFPVGIQQTSNEIPESFQLYQNYPNPFNPSTRIKFDIPLSRGMSEGRGVYVDLKIYNLLGKEVAAIVNDELAPGTYEYEWDASNLSSGVYFYKLVVSEANLSAISFTDTKKLVLSK
ncbi:MAG TPA: T9SS type A sorting domain-containing protein [Ignavibacteria bacterium]